MSLIVYVTIAFVAVFSVVMEWGALVEPSGSTLREMQALSHIPKSPVQPVAAAEPGAAKASDTKRTRTVLNDTPRVVRSAPAQEQRPAVETAGAAPAAGGEEAQAPQPQCDIAACTAAYHSFRPGDCTYQPSNGPRRLCTKGLAANAGASRIAADVTLPPGTACHYRICAEHYSTFDPSTCTYQPLEGPRRLCER